MESMVAIKRRARSAEQKAQRRQTVLQVAERYFLEVGYEAFSMGQLAKRAGLVKGTLYLYFETREELFLTLYEQSLVRWSRAFIGQLSGPLPSRNYAQALYDTAMADGTFVPLLVRLEHVIEHNVSIPRLVASKRVFIDQVAILAKASSLALTVPLAQASEVVKTMGVLLIGATRADQGPSLNNELLPEEVQSLIASFSSGPLFVRNAVRIAQRQGPRVNPNGLKKPLPETQNNREE